MVRYRGFSGAGVAVSKGLELVGGWRAQAGAQLLSLAHWRERTSFLDKAASRGTASLFDATLSWSDHRWSATVSLEGGAACPLTT